jgi:hypothetical protein
MSLVFPNPSRSFDQGGNRVRFWGYDRAIEVSFFVDAAALKQLCPGVGSPETGYLEAFDEARSRIYEVAEEVYERGGKGKGDYAYVLAAGDF